MQVRRPGRAVAFLLGVNSGRLPPHLTTKQPNVSEAMVLQLKTPDELKDIYVGLAIVRYTLAVAIFATNCGILLAFLIQKWRTRRRRPKQRIPPSGCFVINLLIADTMLGAVLVNSVQFKIWPETAVWLAKWHYLCLLRFAVAFLAVCGSQSALLSVVIDRYLAIVHTMRYKDWMTTRNCAQLLAASWVLPIMGCLYFILFGHWEPDMPICSENTVVGNFSLYVWVPINIALLLSIIVIQICVHVELKRYNQTGSVSSNMIRASTHKSARVMLISTSAVACFYGPYDVASVLFVFFPSSVTKLLYDLSTIGTSVTFLLNPCLYSFKTESIRRPVADLLANLRESLVSITTSKPETNEPFSVENAFKALGAKQTSSSTTLNTSLSVAGSPYCV